MRKSVSTMPHFRNRWHSLRVMCPFNNILDLTDFIFVASEIEYFSPSMAKLSRNSRIKQMRATEDIGDGKSFTLRDM
jgi:hypothetical protein